MLNWQSNMIESALSGRGNNTPLHFDCAQCALYLLRNDFKTSGCGNHTPLKPFLFVAIEMNKTLSGCGNHTPLNYFCQQTIYEGNITLQK